MTQNKEYLKTLDPCPPDQFLRAWIDGSLAEKSLESVIESHLEFCASCHLKVMRMKNPPPPLRETIAKRAQAFKNLQLAQQRAMEDGPKPGGIWRTAPESPKDSFGPLVVILEKQAGPRGDTFTVAEVSEDIDQAIHTDVVLEPGESGLQFRCMIRSGIQFSIHNDSVTRFGGALPEPLMEKVSGFCKDAERFNDNIPFSEFVFLKDNQGTELMRRRGITSGTPVKDESDERLEFLELSKARCAYLSDNPSKDVESESKVRPLRSRIPSLRTIFALAAVLATIAVTWESARIMSDRNIEQAKAEQAKQISEMKSQYELVSKEKAQLAAELQAEKQTVAFKITDRMQTEAKRMTAFVSQSQKTLTAATGEIENLKTKMAKVGEDNEELKKKTTQLAALKDEYSLQLERAKTALKTHKIQFAADATQQENSPLLDPAKGKEILQAARSGAVAMLQNLVDNKYYANYAEKETGETPIHFAASDGNLPVIEFLVYKGAEVNSQDKDGKTPLMLAAEKGHEKVVEFLLQAGADAKIYDEQGRTALYLALVKGYNGLARILKQR